MTAQPEPVPVTFTIRLTGETLDGFLVGDAVRYQDVFGTWQVVGVEHVTIET